MKRILVWEEAWLECDFCHIESGHKKSSVAMWSTSGAVFLGARYEKEPEMWEPHDLDNGWIECFVPFGSPYSGQELAHFCCKRHLTAYKKRWEKQQKKLKGQPPVRIA